MRALPLAASFILCLSVRTTAQQVTVDPTFLPDDRGFNYGNGFDAAVNDVAVLADGRMVVAGYFHEYNGVPCHSMARLWPDGTLDTTFDAGYGFDSGPQHILVLPGGKLLVGGYFFAYNNVARWGLARLFPDGALDPTFDPGEAFWGQPEALALQSDGKVLLGGWQFCGTGTQVCIKRFNTDGTLDATFHAGVGVNGNNEPIYDIHVLPDDRILIAGLFDSFDGHAVHNMACLTASGQVDPTFPADLTNGFTRILATCPDGDLIVGGRFTRVGSAPRAHIAKVSTAGVVDPAFHPVFLSNGDTSDRVWAAHVQADGRVLVGGFYDHCGAVAKRDIARLMPDGTVDPTFTTEQTLIGGMGNIKRIVALADGRLLITGQLRDYGNSCIYGLDRVHPDGALDLSFNPGSGLNDKVTTMVVQPDGKLIMSGWSTRVNGIWTRNLVRLDAQGDLDPTFHIGTGLTIYANDIALRPDGRILLAPAGNGLYDGHPVTRVMQLQADGTFDPTFAPDMPLAGVNRLMLQPDGKVLLAGSFNFINGVARRGVARLNTDGSLDAGFAPGTAAVGGLPQTLVLQGDGRIIVAGSMGNWAGQAIGHIVRLLPTGAADPSFNTGTGFDDRVDAMVLQPDGKVVVTGPFTHYNGVARPGIARLLANGSLDTTFDPVEGLNVNWNVLALDDAGRILVGGWFTEVGGQPAGNIVRLKPTGAIDAQFDTGSGFTRNGYATVSTVTSMVPLADGRLLVGGSFTAFNGVGRNRLARLLTPNTVSIAEHGSDPSVITWPNPCDGRGPRIGCADIPSGTPAHVELLDAAGRRITAYDTRIQATLELQLSQPLAPGSYRAVITAGDLRRQASFVVVR